MLQPVPSDHTLRTAADSIGVAVRSRNARGKLRPGKARKRKEDWDGMKQAADQEEEESMWRHGWRGGKTWAGLK